MPAGLVLSVVVASALMLSSVAASAAAPAVPPDFWPPAPLAPRRLPTKGAPRPHIILHVTDDQGWANVGYHNKGHVLTPTMDRLATEEGIRFERHYAFQWCAPSRASLLTGRLPYHVLEGSEGSAMWPPGKGGVTPAAVTRGMTMLPKKLQSVGCESIDFLPPCLRAGGSIPRTLSRVCCFCVPRILGLLTHAHCVACRRDLSNRKGASYCEFLSKWPHLFSTAFY